MGNLVFQATLGGQVNLVGPNTASTYNINVPTVNSTLATLAAQTFAGTQTISSGNLVFSGTSQFVSGDFSNATVASRTAFQSSTTNGSTGIYALPNGTSTAASWQATNAADPTNASKILIATNGSTDVQLVSGINGTGTYLPLSFYTNGSQQMRLDTAGNLGLGVTPSAWWSSVKALQVGTLASLYSGAGISDLSSNAYSDGTNFKYLTTAAASFYRQTGGAHQWNTAASGTAGTNITFIQAMTLDASGNLGVGTSSPGGKLEVSDGTNLIRFVPTVATGTNGLLSRSASAYIPMKYIATQHIFAGYGDSSSNEAGRFDSSGNLLVGTTSTINSSKLTVSNSGNAANFATSSSGSYSLVCQNTGAGSTNFVIFQTGSGPTSVGSITYNGSNTVYSTSSDYRLKEVSGSLSGYKERVMALQPKQGSWKSNGSEFRGFLAHEFAVSYPASVNGEKDAVDLDGNPEYQGMQAGSAEVIADLVALIQEQQNIIQQLQADVAALKAPK